LQPSEPETRTRNQPIAETLDHGLDDAGNPGAQTRFDDEARIGARCGLDSFDHSLVVL